MTFRVTIKRKALKVLENINEPDYSRIKKAIYSLATNPRPIGYKKLKGREGFRIRIGDYRIIYVVLNTILLVEVINIGDRKDVYE